MLPAALLLYMPEVAFVYRRPYQFNVYASIRIVIGENEIVPRNDACLGIKGFVPPFLFPVIRKIEANMFMINELSIARILF